MLVRNVDMPWLRFIVEGEDGGPDVDVVDDVPVEPADGEDPVDAPDEEDKPLGPAGERALEAMKEKERKTRAELRQLKAELAALKAPRDGEATPEQVREQIRQELANEFRKPIIEANVKAAAAGLFADPEDAVAFLDMSDFDVDASGNVEVSDIQDALKDLLARKPHLAKQGGAQGPSKRRIPEVPADPARVQTTALTLQEKIAAAQKAGDFKTVIALQNELLEVN